MAPNLDTLPVETLSLVLGHFCLHCSKEHGYESPHGYFRCRQNGEEQQADQPSWYSRDYRHTLYSVCLVSKRLASVAQALLHYEFVPGYGDAWRSDQFSWDGRLESFLRTVAARKDLAELMKRIFEHPHLLRAVTEEEAQLTLDEVLGTAPAGPAAGNAQLLSEYLDAFDLLREPRVSFPGPQRHPGWKLVGVLLASAPNLERLSLQVEGTGCVPAAAFSALRGLSVSSAGAVLSQLKTLDFCPRSAWWVFHAKHHATGILEAAATGKSEGSSSLSTLNLHMCGGIGQVKLQGLGSVQALRITLGRLYNGDLSVLLNSCRGGSGLKSFYYEARSPRVWVGHVEGSLTVTYDNHFLPVDAFTHLFPHAATLTSLHLDLRARGHADRHSHHAQDASSEATQTTLARFPALKHVFLHGALVCRSGGAEGDGREDDRLLTGLLPPNIESLRLAGDQEPEEVFKEKLAKALVGLAEAKTRAGEAGRGRPFSALARVRCDAEVDGEGRVLQRYGVPEAFALAGVDFVCDGWEYPRSEPTMESGEDSDAPALCDMDEPEDYLHEEDLVEIPFS